MQEYTHTYIHTYIHTGIHAYITVKKVADAPGRAEHSIHPLLGRRPVGCSVVSFCGWSELLSQLALRLFCFGYSILARCPMSYAEIAHDKYSYFSSWYRTSDRMPLQNKQMSNAGQWGFLFARSIIAALCRSVYAHELLILRTVPWGNPRVEVSGFVACRAASRPLRGSCRNPWCGTSSEGTAARRGLPGRASRSSLP